MKNLLILISILCLFSCKEKSNDLYGVWYTIDNSHPESNYIEAHITDSVISIVNNVNIRYIAKYKFENNELTEYVLDLYNPSKIINTLGFQVQLNEDSMHLTNVRNPSAQSHWKKAEDTKPYDFLNNDSLSSFIPELKNRYLENYLYSNKPNNLDQYLKFFDRDWELY